MKVIREISDFIVNIGSDVGSLCFGAEDKNPVSKFCFSPECLRWNCDRLLLKLRFVRGVLSSDCRGGKGDIASIYSLIRDSKRGTVSGTP